MNKLKTRNSSSVEDSVDMTMKLKSLISEFSRCKESRIKDSTRIREDLGLDSFAALEILVAIEKEFSMKVPEADLGALKTFSQILSYVKHMSKE